MQEKLKKFLNKKSLKPKIIVIYWPTWSWKTSLSIGLAKEVPSEIISTDSRQIFKYLNIGTGKITEKEKEWITHHMIDIVEPNQNYSVWEFKQEAEKIIDEIYKKWKIPILCWWTGLYIDSLIYDFKIPRVPASEEIRNKLEEEREKYWNEYIYQKLVEIDPEYARELHPNNYRYVIRAIEVKMITWKSKTEFREEKTLKYDTLFLTPEIINDRKKLYERIDKRVGMMFDEWLIEEVDDLLKKWYKKDDFWMKSIWYKEIIDYLDNKITLPEVIALVQKNNRNYAKKQYTWFRKYFWK